MSLEMIQNVLHSVTNVLNNPLVKKGLKYANTLAGAYATFAEKPTSWNAAKSMFSVLNDIAVENEVWAYDYFDDDDGWIEPFDRDFNGAIYRILSRYPGITIKTSSNSQVIKIHEINGITFGYALSTKSSVVGGKVDKVYTKVQKLPQAKEFLRQQMWQTFGGQSLVMRRNDGVGRNLDEDRVVFEPDEAHKSMPSRRADEYSRYLQRCIDAGVPRSVMFYGPPGTGKSTTAKTIVENLGLRSFRIRVNDADGLDAGVLSESISIFKPDAVILDDFDRARNQAILLETLEYFHERVKLVIATVNRRDSLDEALLRPGRFDELILVRQMDEDVVRKVLGEENLEAFDLIKDWPIAFIQEYVKRTRFMDKDEAIETIKKLASRVDRLAEFDNDSDLSRVMSNKFNDVNNQVGSFGEALEIPQDAVPLENPPGPFKRQVRAASIDNEEFNRAFKKLVKRRISKKRGSKKRERAAARLKRVRRKYRGR